MKREKNSSKTWKTPKIFDCFGIRAPNSMRLMKIRDLSFPDPFQLQYHSSMPCWFGNSNQKPVGDFLLIREPTSKIFVTHQLEWFQVGWVKFFYQKHSYSMSLCQNNQRFQSFFSFSGVFFSLSCSRSCNGFLCSHLFHNCELSCPKMQTRSDLVKFWKNGTG